MDQTAALRPLRRSRIRVLSSAWQRVRVRSSSSWAPSPLSSSRAARRPPVSPPRTSMFQAQLAPQLDYPWRLGQPNVIMTRAYSRPWPRNRVRTLTMPGIRARRASMRRIKTTLGIGRRSPSRVWGIGVRWTSMIRIRRVGSRRSLMGCLLGLDDLSSAREVLVTVIHDTLTVISWINIGWLVGSQVFVTIVSLKSLHIDYIYKARLYFFLFSASYIWTVLFSFRYSTICPSFAFFFSNCFSSSWTFTACAQLVLFFNLPFLSNPIRPFSDPIDTLPTYTHSLISGHCSSTRSPMHAAFNCAIGRYVHRYPNCNRTDDT